MRGMRENGKLKFLLVDNHIICYYFYNCFILLSKRTYWKPADWKMREKAMYNTFMQELVQINFLPFGIMLFLGFYLWFNDVYEHELTRYFIVPMLLLGVLVIDDNIDYYLFNGRSVQTCHVVTAIIGYNIRIFLMLSLILIELRNVKWKIKAFLFLPAIINLLITSTALFTKWVFWYGENGVVMRGPLAYTPHVISFLYAILLCGYGIYIQRFGRWQESIIVCTATLLSVLGTLAETIFQLRGILIGVIAMDVTFFYLYFHIEHFKMDILTGALNRISFYADSQKLNDRNDVTIFSIDMNDLKRINDTKGHAAGDKAIKEVANMIHDHLQRGSKLYRVGGDEFVVICAGTAKESILWMERELQEVMDASEYSFAFGKAYMDKGETFEQVYMRADHEMYENKRKIKAGREIR